MLMQDCFSPSFDFDRPVCFCSDVDPGNEDETEDEVVAALLSGVCWPEVATAESPKPRKIRRITDSLRKGGNLLLIETQVGVKSSVLGPDFSQPSQSQKCSAASGHPGCPDHASAICLLRPSQDQSPTLSNAAFPQVRDPCHSSRRTP
jgi:hypothetical protein